MISVLQWYVDLHMRAWDERKIYGIKNYVNCATLSIVDIALFVTKYYVWFGERKNASGRQRKREKEKRLTKKR